MIGLRTDIWWQSQIDTRKLFKIVARAMSAVGHSLPMHSAPVLPYVGNGLKADVAGRRWGLQQTAKKIAGVKLYHAYKFPPRNPSYPFCPATLPNHVRFRG
jgi:hypothetical protein